MKIWSSCRGTAVQATLERAFDWCERFEVTAQAPQSGEGEAAFWRLVLQHKHKLGGVYVSAPAASERWLAQTLAADGQLKWFTGDDRQRGNLVWAQCGDAVHLFVATGRLDGESLASETFPWLVFEGEVEALPEGLSSLRGELRADAQVPSEDEVDAFFAAIHHKPIYRRRISSVASALPPGDGAQGSFLEWSETQQGLALWSALLGEGCLDLEQAIRLAAQRLRAQGLASYQALRQRGELYRTIEERLKAARRTTPLFDRPRRGHIRAIQRDLDAMSADDWRDCLMRALSEHSRVERGQALRLAFDYAREVYGVEAQRLRGGGRAERAIKSAINSCIRQGYLERDGAMYVLRVAEYGEAELPDVTSAPREVPDEPQGAQPTTGEGAHASTPADVAVPSTERTPVAPGGPDPTSTPAPEEELTARPAPFAAEEDPTPTTHWALQPDRAAAQPVDGSPTHAAPPPVHRPAGSKPVAHEAAEPLTPARSLFEMSLEELEFPTRTLTWAHRKQLRTVGELVAWNPADFAAEPNVGRLTVEQTRAALEEALGCSWQEAWSAHEHQVPLRIGANVEDEDAVTSGGAQGWAAFAQNLPPDARELALASVELPARMRTFVLEQEIPTVGALLARSYADLQAQPNLGRKSLNDTLDAIADALAERENPKQYESFMDLWRAKMTSLQPMHRLILSRRSGLLGPKESLEQVGSMLGLTRERVRQIEAHITERLRHKPRYQRALLRRLEAAFGSGRAVSLELLNEEPWWQGIADKRALLGYVLERTLDAAYRLFEAPSGKPFIVCFDPTQFETAYQNARARVEKLEFPTDYTSVLEIVRDECERLDLALLDELEQQIRAELVFASDLDDAEPASAEAAEASHERPTASPGGERVLGLGGHRADLVLAYLNAQPQPVAIAELEARLGRGHLPDEVLHFKRGVVGLRKHFPDFEHWRERLVPLCIEAMQARPAGRQWLVPELHEELNQQCQLPAWLGHWHLASLLRTSGEVDYLGRLRVALRGSAEARLHFEDLFFELLQRAGGPLTTEALLAQARQHTDVQENTANLMLREAPFVRLDLTRVGLLERDVPGGPEAVAEAVAAVTDHLEATQKGLTPHQATQLVQALSPTHQSWSRQLVTSLLRNEASLRIARSKTIGLADWEDVRCPARGEFIRREVQRCGGVCSIEAIDERLTRTYGSAPSRPQLAALVAGVGLILDGGSICRPPSDSQTPLTLQAQSESPRSPSPVPQAQGEQAQGEQAQSAQAHAVAPEGLPSEQADGVERPADPLAEPTTHPAAPSPAQPANAAAASPPAPANTAAPANTTPAPASPAATSPRGAAAEIRAVVETLAPELQEAFHELVLAPPMLPTAMQRQIDEHVAAFEDEARVNEFVDLEGARQLAQHSRQLLSRFSALTPTERQLAQAAIRYFVIAENIESDFDIGGLDDDKQIMNAVLEHLGPLNESDATVAN